MWGIEAGFHSFLRTVVDGGERPTAGQDHLAPGRGLTSPSRQVFLPYILNDETYSTQTAVSYSVKHVAYDVYNIHDKSREQQKRILTFC